MRRRSQSELVLLFAPWIKIFQVILVRLHWWLGLVGIVYLGSGVTTVQPDEVAIVLRFGKVNSEGTAQAIHQPGLLLAYPKPIDEVVRIKIKKVYQQEIKGLHFTARQNEGQPLTFLSSTSIDPEKVGYALTGDGNVVHLSFVANYQISDPIAFAIQTYDPKKMLQNAIQSAAIQNVASLSVDSILSDGRQELIEDISVQSQQHLDSLGVGITLVSLEVVDLVPPYQVKSDFNAVQSAYIEAQTSIQRAEEYKVSQIPLAESERNKKLQEAKSYAATLLAAAHSDSALFLAILKEYKQNPRVVRERLYKESIERTLKDAGKLQFVPDPVGSRYVEGFRITVDPKGKK
jgi:modulator of FtsH protease HflK